METGPSAAAHLCEVDDIGRQRCAAVPMRLVRIVQEAQLLQEAQKPFKTLLPKTVMLTDYTAQLGKHEQRYWDFITSTACTLDKS